MIWNVRRDAFDVRDHGWLFGVLVTQAVEQGLDCVPSDLAVEVEQLAGAFSLELADPAHGHPDLRLNLDPSVLEVLPLALGELLQIPRLHRLITHDRDGDDATRRCFDTETVLLGELVQLSAQAIAALSQLACQLLPGLRITLRLKDTTDLQSGLTDE